MVVVAIAIIPTYTAAAIGASAVIVYVADI